MTTVCTSYAWSFVRMYVSLTVLVVEHDVQATLRSAHMLDIEFVAGLMKRDPNLHVSVHGHVNFCKTSEAALKLSEVRARARVCVCGGDELWCSLRRIAHSQ